jgi:hypothetical protein
MYGNRIASNMASMAIFLTKCTISCASPEPLEHQANLTNLATSSADS